MTPTPLEIQTDEELDKTGHMLPCNGCGLCCKEQVCVIGQDVFGEIDAPCPLLVKRKGLYRCGMVLMEASRPVEKKLAQALGIGMGCCADDVETTF